MAFIATTLRIAAGVIAWGVHFGLVYGVTALACARGAPSIAVGVTIGATLIGIVLTATIVALGWRRRAAFDSWLSATLAALALVAIVFEGLAVLVVAPCA